jgi:glutamate-1-semialdehyde 2,1-aminomutase
MGTDPGLGRRAELLFHHLLNHGVYMGAQGFFVLSTATTEADVDHVLEAVLSALRSLPE